MERLRKRLLLDGAGPGRGLAAPENGAVGIYAAVSALLAEASDGSAGRPDPAAVVVALDPETVAEENRGTVRANCVMPSVLDTPMNREMMTPSDDWVDPADAAQVMLFLCSEAASPTSGAAVPVYGEA